MFGRRTLLAVLISVLAVIALGVSGYLTWVAWQASTVVGCSGDSVIDCDHVLASRWSKWMGLPVSLLGMATYAAILGLVWPAASRPNGAAVTGLFAVGALAAGAAVWFIGLQAIQLQSYCAFCLTAHCCALCIGVLATLMFLDTREIRNYDQMRSMLGVESVDSTAEVAEASEPVSVLRLVGALAFSAIGLVALMGGQLLVDPGEAMAMEEFELVPLTESDESGDNGQDVPADAPQDEVADELADKSTEGAADDFLAADGPPNEVDVPGESGEWIEDDLGNAAMLEEPNSDKPMTIDSIFAGGRRRAVFKAMPAGVEVSDMPVLGNPGAPHILLEMMDYTCDHCRKLHPHLEAAIERYGDQLGIVIYNVPLSKKCNQNIKKDYPGKKYSCDYAQLSIGVWKLAPEHYAEFHHWLLEPEKVPSVTKAKRQARSLAGDEVLLDASVRADASRRLAAQTKVFSRLKSGLPILLLQDGALRGVPEESEKLFEYLEAKLGIEPQ